jgi:hypothetical protein
VEGVMAQHPQADDVCNEKIIMVGTWCLWMLAVWLFRISR